MRKFAMWLIDNIPLGKLAPHILGLTVGATGWKRTDNKCLNLDGAKDRAAS